MFICVVLGVIDNQLILSFQFEDVLDRWLMSTCDCCSGGKAFIREIVKIKSWDCHYKKKNGILKLNLRKKKIQYIKLVLHNICNLKPVMLNLKNVWGHCNEIFFPGSEKISK